MEWSIQRTTRFDNRYKKLAKKHRNECQNAFTNLNRYFEGLREGGKPAQLSVHSFVHNEGEGAYSGRIGWTQDDDGDSALHLS